jgi:predicted transcriptional regulator
METNEQTRELLSFFKALADANRLKILGLLATEKYSVEQLAALLDLRPSTVSHHLARLNEVGLVSARAEGNYNVYQLETSALEEKARRLLAEDILPAVAADVDLDAYDRKVIHDYSLPNGRLKTIPSQLKKRLAVLRYIVQAFDSEVQYSEQEVNDILERFHEDTTSLRRELIDHRLMDRQTGGKAYWKIDK